MNKENSTPIENETVNEINICDEVLQSLAAHTVKETEGVSLSTTLADGLVEKFVKKSGNRAIKVEADGQDVSLDVHISVVHGIKIQNVCAKLQAEIKSDIETVTDLIVKSVNIYVDNITMPTEEKTKEESVNTEIIEQEN